MAKRRAQEQRDPLHDALWGVGRLAYKLRPHGQTQAYEFVQKWLRENPGNAGPLVLNCRRRFGKSFLTINLALGWSCETPRHITRIIAPTKDQGLRIFSEQFNEIVRDKPAFIDIKEVGDEIHVFNNQWNAQGDVADPTTDFSIVSFHGSEVAGGARIRGLGADKVITDEMGFMKDPEDLWKNVLIWLLHGSNRKQPLALIVSTPPKIGGHYLVKEVIPKALQEGGNRYFEMPMSKDLDASKTDEKFLIGMCGSKDSISWQREAECKLIPDAGEQIVPEWTNLIHLRTLQKREPEFLFDQYQMPEYYYPMVAVDMGGVRDPTGVLFWFWDYEHGRLVVLHELLLRETNLLEVASALRDTEHRIFKDAALFGELRRYGDLRPAEYENLRQLFKMQVTLVDPRDRKIAVDALNADVAAGRVWIHKSCVDLKYQLENGVYKSRDSDKFVRNVNLGHCDLIAALVVAHRQVERLAKRNPRPPGEVRNGKFVPDEEEDTELPVIGEVTYQL
jgi:hypothetical protein